MKYDLILSYRNLKKNKIVSSINILGLAVGFTFVILAGRYLYTENTFDTFHKNYHSIYRLEKNNPDYGRAVYNSNIMFTWLKDNIPEVREATRILNDGGIGRQRNLVYDNTKYNVRKPLIIDPQFFSIFSFQVLAGETASFEHDKYSIALTESLAKKIFGDENPVGQTVRYKDEVFQVKAILQAPPANSSITFDALLPISNLPDYVTDDWRNNTLQIFILAANNVSRSALEQKIQTGVMSVFQSLGFSENITADQYLLNPLGEIYYSGNSNDGICIHGNKKQTFLLSSVAGIVLLIAITSVRLLKIAHWYNRIHIKMLALQNSRDRLEQHFRTLVAHIHPPIRGGRPHVFRQTGFCATDGVSSTQGFSPLCCPLSRRL